MPICVPVQCKCYCIFTEIHAIHGTESTVKVLSWIQIKDFGCIFTASIVNAQ